MSSFESTAARLAQAEGVYRRLLSWNREDADAHNDLANILEELGRPDEAEAAYRCAIASRPTFAEAHYNLGLLLQRQRRLDAAVDSYRRALAARPGLVQAHNNLGAALRDLRLLDEARECFAAAVRLQPDYADAQFNQAMCRLMMGDYAQGWPQYEWRWRTRQAEVARRPFARPLWLGGESPAGRTVLLHAEQGFGDTLQFCRYAPAVASLGARVVLEAPPELERLLARLGGVDQVVAQGGALPHYAAHPAAHPADGLNTRLDTVPSNTPYLTPIRSPFCGGADACRARRAYGSDLFGPGRRD